VNKNEFAVPAHQYDVIESAYVASSSFLRACHHDITESACSSGWSLRLVDASHLQI
jgi:hypothetical protein